MYWVDPGLLAENFLLAQCHYVRRCSVSGFRPRLGIDWTAPVQEGTELCRVAGPFERDKVDMSSQDNVGNRCYMDIGISCLR